MVDPYTLTGASDWPILAIVGSFVVILLGIVYRGLPKKADLETLAERFENALEKFSNKHENRLERENAALKEEMRGGRQQCQTRVEGDFKSVWQAINDCQKECCPRRKP